MPRKEEEEEEGKRRETVQRSFRLPRDQLDEAQEIADRYAEGNVSLVTRRAIELGIEQLKKHPNKLLGARWRPRP